MFNLLEVSRAFDSDLEISQSIHVIDVCIEWGGVWREGV